MQKKNQLPNIGESIGNINFSDDNPEFHEIRKSPVSRDKLKRSEISVRTYENNQEFSVAVTAATLLRHSVKSMLDYPFRPNDSQRMIKKMMEIISHDVTNSRGQRNIADGPLHRLLGYAFNNLEVHTGMLDKLRSIVNRAAGELTVQVQSFKPAFYIRPRAAVTHFKILTAAIELDFGEKQYIRHVQESITMPLDETPTGEMHVTHALTPASANPLILVFGLKFLYLSGDHMQSLVGSQFTIIHVDKV